MSPSPSVIDWTQVRSQLETFTLRMAALYVFAAGGLYFFLQISFLHESLIFAVSTSAGVCLGVWLIAALGASVLALPGWLIRGQYRFKFLMVGCLAATMTSSLMEPCRLLALSDTGKYIAFPLLAIFGFASSLLGTFPFFASLTPERWSSKVGKFCIGLSVLAMIGSVSPLLKQSRNDRGRQLFSVERSSSVRMLSGRHVDFDSLKSELVNFAQSNENERKPSSEVLVLDAPVDLEANRSPAASTAVLPLNCSPTESKPSQIAASIHFVNVGLEAVKIQWVDYKGAIQDFRILKAGQSYLQSTYFGHHWLVVSSHNECLGSSTVRQTQEEIKVGLQVR